MANTRAWLLGPTPSNNDGDIASPTAGYQIAGHRSGEGTDSVLEQLQKDPSRKVTDPPGEGHPEIDFRSHFDHNN